MARQSAPSPFAHIRDLFTAAERKILDSSFGHALARATAHHGGKIAFAPENIWVIGDTPHDIDCANAIGARTIAVATGGYSLAELQAHGAWRVLEQLPPPNEFLAMIGVGNPEPDARMPA